MMNVCTSGLRAAFLWPGDESGKACSESVKGGENVN